MLRVRRPRCLVKMPRRCHRPGLQRQLRGRSPPSARHGLQGEAGLLRGLWGSPVAEAATRRLAVFRRRKCTPGCMYLDCAANEPVHASGWRRPGACGRLPRRSLVGLCRRALAQAQQCFLASERTPTPAAGKPSIPGANRRGMAAAAAHAEHAAEEAAVSRHVCTRGRETRAGRRLARSRRLDRPFCLSLAPWSLLSPVVPPAG